MGLLDLKTGSKPTPKPSPAPQAVTRAHASFTRPDASTEAPHASKAGILEGVFEESPPWDFDSKTEEVKQGEAAQRQDNNKAPSTHTNMARRGFVQWRDGGQFLHYCEVCGEWGGYGVGFNSRTGNLGRWYCREHRPEA